MSAALTTGNGGCGSRASPSAPARNTMPYNEFVTARSTIAARNPARAMSLADKITTTKAANASSREYVLLPRRSFVPTDAALRAAARSASACPTASRIQ
jgi:hypothetical protein